ncbi:MAG: sugar ABC transporter substrate-binding protein [Treponema sp.]|jgi:ABC-type sugar transport system substrate-binding protein|nr:sugar ABC transporter substrate-binding protein [Treponema sp.]
MKKMSIFSGFSGVLLAVVFLAAGCSRGRETSAGSGNTPVKVVGFDAMNSNVFNSAIQDGCREMAGARGWEVMILQNDTDPEKTLRNIDSFITRQVDYIFSGVIDAGLQETIYQKCRAAGMPVAFEGLEIEGYPTVAGNNYGGGRFAGEKLAAEAKKKWNGQVDLLLMIEAAETGEVNEKRMGGMFEGVTENLDIPQNKIVWIDASVDDLLKGSTMIANTLTANPDAKRILVCNFADVVGGVGTYNVAKAANRLDQILLTGYHVADEATPGILKQIPDIWIGQVDLMGYAFAKTAFDIFDKYEAGETVEPTMYYTDFVWIDSTNVDDYYPPSN